MSGTPRGRSVDLRLKEQSAFGTLASGDWENAPWYSETFKPNDPLEKDEELGGERHNARDPSRPAPGLPRPTGDFEVPLDHNTIGPILKAVFGAPLTSTGDDPNFVHTFESGLPDLAFFSMEFKQRADVFKIVDSLAVNSLQLGMAREGGYRRARLGGMARRVYNAGATLAGTPVSYPTRSKVPARVGALRINDVLATLVTEEDFTFTNGHEGVAELNGQAGGFLTGIDPGNTGLQGRFKARFNTSAILDLFTGAPEDGGTPFKVEVEYLLSANRSVTFVFPEVFGPPIVATTPGPDGLSIDATWEANQVPGGSSRAMVEATLKTLRETI